MRKINAGIINCDLHGMYYAALMAKHDPIALRDDKISRGQAAHFYFYTHYKDPARIMVPTVGGFRIVKVWDRNGKRAEAISRIWHDRPEICDTFEEVSDSVDLVFIADCNGDGSDHLELAKPGLDKGIPTFVDKPFCYRSEEGAEFLKIANKNGAPVTSFSVLPLQRSFKRFSQELSELDDIVAGITYGTCDLKSKWGGVFFYGIHQVDMVLKAFGYNVTKALITKNGNGATGQLIYSDDKIVTMHLIKESCPGFAITAVDIKQTLHREIGFDKNIYLTGVRKFTKMFKNGIEPERHEHMLKPVKILEAMERSIKSGQIEKVIK